MNLPRMAVALALSLCAGSGAQAQYDVLIQGARLLDGAGNPWRLANIAITGDRIAAVGLLPGATAGRVIDGTGLFVAPRLHRYPFPCRGRSRLPGAESWPAPAGPGHYDGGGEPGSEGARPTSWPSGRLCCKMAWA